MNGLLNKKDIMSLYKCGSDKALRLLKFMYDVGYANKFGKEYYVTSEALNKFLADYAGKNVMIWDVSSRFNYHL